MREKDQVDQSSKFNVQRCATGAVKEKERQAKFGGSESWRMLTDRCIQVGGILARVDFRTCAATRSGAVEVSRARDAGGVWSRSSRQRQSLKGTDRIEDERRRWMPTIREERRSW